MEEDKQTAKEALAMQLQAVKDFSAPGPRQINHIIAQNVLHEELGYYTDKPKTYQLDQETRDRLFHLSCWGCG